MLNIENLILMEVFMLVPIIVTFAVTAAIASPIFFNMGSNHRKKEAEKDLESAEMQAKKVIEEAEKGITTQEENDLLNHHICISHSNLEDLLLFAAVGGAYMWMLLSRWIMSWILVWERKLEKTLKLSKI